MTTRFMTQKQLWQRLQNRRNVICKLRPSGAYVLRTEGEATVVDIDVDGRSVTGLWRKGLLERSEGYIFSGYDYVYRARKARAQIV